MAEFQMAEFIEQYLIYAVLGFAVPTFLLLGVMLVVLYKILKSTFYDEKTKRWNF